MADQQLSSEELSWLDKFRKSVQEFRNAFDTMVQNRSYVAARPEWQAEYNSLFNEGSIVKRAVETVAATVDGVVGAASSAWNSVKDFFGFDGIPPRRPQGLGVLPLLPIAAISGAIAYMGAWVAKVYIFNRKLEEAKRLESLGVNPQEAAALTQGYGENSLADAINAIKVPLLIGGGIFLLVKYGDKLLPNRGS